MTTATAAAAAADQNRRLADTEYQFSLERLSELNRSPAPLLLARLNRACPSYGKTPAESDNPTRLMSEIRRHCPEDDNYIRSEMPLQEIVFRILLLRGDTPTTLGQLHRELTERWSSPLRPITITMTGLARILDHDVFYGFEGIPAPEPEPEPEPEMELAPYPATDFDGAPMLDAAPSDAELARLAAALVSNLDDAGAADDDEDDDLEDLYDDDGDDDAED